MKFGGSNRLRKKMGDIDLKSSLKTWLDLRDQCKDQIQSILDDNSRLDHVQGMSGPGESFPVHPSKMTTQLKQKIVDKSQRLQDLRDERMENLKAVAEALYAADAIAQRNENNATTDADGSTIYDLKESNDSIYMLILMQIRQQQLLECCIVDEVIGSALTTGLSSILLSVQQDAI